MNQEEKDVLALLAEKGDEASLDVIVAAVTKAVALMYNHLKDHQEEWDKLVNGDITKLHALGFIPLAAVVFLCTPNAMSGDDPLRNWAQHVFTATITDIETFTSLQHHILEKMQNTHDEVEKLESLQNMDASGSVQ